MKPTTQRQNTVMPNPAAQDAGQPAGAPTQPDRRRALRIASAALLSAPALVGLARAQGGHAMPTMKMGGSGHGAMDMPMDGPGERAAAPAPARAPFRRALLIPPMLMGKADRGVLRYSLTARAGTSRLVEGLNTPTWGYNGALLGPVLAIPRGRPVHISVTNGLAQSLTTHWHGALVPGRMDGGPHSLIQPGTMLDYRFALDQPGATLWYHPHTEYRTGAQTYAGLAGMLLVDDGIDRKLGLPHTWGVDDIPVIVQDRRIAASGQLIYMSEAMRDLMGMKGDRFLVNGREQPYVEVPAQHVRLRLLNGSNARSYHFALDDRRPFDVIASDSGLLARPAVTRALLLGPGERAEIVVDLSKDQGRALVLQSRSGEVAHLLGSSSDDSDTWDLRTFDLLRLVVTRPTGVSTSVPGVLADIEALALTGAPVRRITLQGMSKAMKPMRSDVDRGAPPNSGPGGMSLGIAGQQLFSLNHRFFDMSVIDQRARLGGVEIWEFVNDQEMAHPMHIHGVAFQVLSRDGNPPPVWERGWKDTVLVRRGETVRVGMRFTQPADAAHPYMYHCHILEHEANGMMGQFTVS